MSWRTLETMRQRCALALATLSLSSCGAPREPSKAPVAATESAFELVAEGPCGRLSAQALGARTLIVYGETGYDLHDWLAGEPLAAAQSFVELRAGGVYRTPSLYDGLPTNAGGYVAADLQLGESDEEGPWLFAVETRYAPRGVGRLFDRRGRVFARKGKTWAATAHEGPVPLPGAARTLPPLPIDTMCEAKDLRFLPLASARLASGVVLIAGRCQDQGHVNYPETTVLIAHGKPGETNWRIERAPNIEPIDGIVNLGLYARAANDAYLVAWEPFKPPEARRPYLARWDGTRWTAESTGIEEGLMSITGTSDGTLYVAAGRALYRKPRGAAFTPVPLPPLRFASDARPSTLRVHTVKTLPNDDVWVEATYRVRLPKSAASAREGWGDPNETRASALYRLGRGASKIPPLFCDAREPAERGLVKVE